MALTSPPARARQRQLFWPTLLPAEWVTEQVTIGGQSWLIDRAQADGVHDRPLPVPGRTPSKVRDGYTVRAPLGRIAGSRSGDKGGNATLGLWARTDACYDFLSNWWTSQNVASILAVPPGVSLRLWHIPSLRAVGVTVVGWLRQGTATNVLLDTQAKGLGEFVRSRYIDIPADLLDD